MDGQDEIGLLNDAENGLLARLAAAADAAETARLRGAVAEVRTLRDVATLRGLDDRIARLDRLSGIVEEATASLRDEPAAASGLSALLDSISAARAASADPAPAIAPSARPSPAPSPATAIATVVPDASPAVALATLFATCVVRAERVAAVDRDYVAPLLAGRRAYDTVAERTGAPWWVVGTIHGLEGRFDFATHLHNGDPLTARTVHHPPGRPLTGDPPFDWTESAVDALTLAGLAGLGDWDLGNALDRLERYNGLGYRRRGVPSPYLWSFSNHYTKGKFVADHRFDPEARSAQCGAGTLARRLMQTGRLDLPS